MSLYMTLQECWDALAFESPRRFRLQSSLAVQALQDMPFWFPVPQEAHTILMFLRRGPLPEIYARCREGEAGTKLWELSHHQAAAEWMRTLDGWKRIREDESARALYLEARAKIGAATIGGPAGGDDAPSDWTEADERGYLIARAAQHLARFNDSAMLALGASCPEERAEMDKRPDDRRGTLDRLAATYSIIR